MLLTKGSNLQQIGTLLLQSATLQHLTQIHSRLILLSLHQHHFLLLHLISLSYRFHAPFYAFTIYSHIPHPTTHLFNNIIQSFSRTPSLHSNAFPLYLFHLRNTSKTSTTRPDCFTFPPLLASLTSAYSSLQLNQELHSHIVKFGAYTDVYVSTALLNAYCKLGSAESARRVFGEMEVRSVVTYNSLVSGLGKCGEVDLARAVFEGMPERNVVSWTCMIAGYARNGYYYETLALFNEMGSACVKPNEFTFVSVLSACANLGALGLGKRVHSLLKDSGYVIDLFLGSALIDMYSKCGAVADAMTVFNEMPNRNVVVCSAMIVGLAMNGRGLEAIRVFEDMRSRGIFPNDITFVGVLCACCHIGLVDEGWNYFNCMRNDYSIEPKLQHYACMVDLLGRAGRLSEAYRFIMDMPIELDVVVWGALLGACRIHQNFGLGKYVAHQILEIEPMHSGSFVFLSNVYARKGDFEGVKKVKQAMGISRTKKTPGNSWIEVNDIVHHFFAGDISHPQTDKIYAELDELAKLLEAEGYLPDIHSVICNIEEEDKEHSLYVHSEKLALAFGLISTPGQSSIRIVKNLRVCNDCHLVIKLISKIVRRDIIVRDSNRFHHFSGGICSCHDYW